MSALIGECFQLDFNPSFESLTIIHYAASCCNCNHCTGDGHGVHKKTTQGTYNNVCRINSNRTIPVMLLIF